MNPNKGFSHYLSPVPMLVSRNDLGDYLEKKSLFVSSLGIEKDKISERKIKPVEVKIIRTENIGMEMSR